MIENERERERKKCYGKTYVKTGEEILLFFGNLLLLQSEKFLSQVNLGSPSESPHQYL